MQTPLSDAEETHYLLVEVGEKRCALPIRSVVEVMRPLVLEGWHHPDSVVSGVAYVRGHNTPVVYLERIFNCALLPQARDPNTGRWILLRCDQGAVILAVDAVVEVCPKEQLHVEVLPSLLAEVTGNVVVEMGRRDQSLLTILATSLLLPDSVWDAHTGNDHHAEAEI